MARALHRDNIVEHTARRLDAARAARPSDAGFGGATVAAGELRLDSRADVATPPATLGTKRDRSERRARGLPRIRVDAAAQRDGQDRKLPGPKRCLVARSRGGSRPADGARSRPRRSRCHHRECVAGRGFADAARPAQASRSTQGLASAAHVILPDPDHKRHSERATSGAAASAAGSRHPQ